MKHRFHHGVDGAKRGKTNVEDITVACGYHDSINGLSGRVRAPALDVRAPGLRGGGQGGIGKHKAPNQKVGCSPRCRLL